MSTETLRPLYILVDDDETNNSISRLLIANTIPDAEVVTFENPQNGLLYIRNDFAVDERTRATLLLNLNMPLMSGWEFLDNLLYMDKEVTDRIDVYILSASIDPSDRKRSGGIEIVKGFLDKPLTHQTILTLRNT